MGIILSSYWICMLLKLKNIMRNKLELRHTEITWENSSGMNSEFRGHSRNTLQPNTHQWLLFTQDGSQNYVAVAHLSQWATQKHTNTATHAAQHVCVLETTHRAQLASSLLPVTERVNQTWPYFTRLNRAGSLNWKRWPDVNSNL